MKILKRNIDLLKRLAARLKELFGGSSKSLWATLLVIAQLTGALLFGTPTCGDGQTLDMSKFTDEPTWADEFNDGVFDKTCWSGHYVWGDNATYKRDYAYWNRCMTSFEDGNLIVSVDYLEDGPSEPEGPDGPAYFSYGMDTNPKTASGKIGFEQTYGYFECRCILPKGDGMNPAFWLLSDGMWADDTDGGVSGCEIDVFETDYKQTLLNKNSVYHTIHIDSYGDAHSSENQGKFYADDPYEQFNTYGVEWNPEGYTFYINGVATSHTAYGGACTVPLYVILSVGVDSNIENNDELPGEFIVDYVRAYQYK